MTPDRERMTVAALWALIVLQGVMLTSLYAGVPPHPPRVTPLFGIAPFLAASLALCLAAIQLGPLTAPPGRAVSILAAVAALVSFGPQKYVDAQIGLIWPAVVAGQGAVALIIGCVVLERRGNGTRRAET